MVDLSPDGSNALVRVYPADRSLWVVPLLGGSARRVGNLEGAFSPDGASVVYSTAQASGFSSSGTMELNDEDWRLQAPALQRASLLRSSGRPMEESSGSTGAVCCGRLRRTVRDFIRSFPAGMSRVFNVVAVGRLMGSSIFSICKVNREPVGGCSSSAKCAYPALLPPS